MAWRGVAWRGVAWRGVAWRGVAWRGVAWRDKRTGAMMENALKGRIIFITYFLSHLITRIRYGFWRFCKSYLIH